MLLPDESKKKQYLEEAQQIALALGKKYGMEGIAILGAWVTPRPEAGPKAVEMDLGCIASGTMPFKIHLSDMLRRVAASNSAELEQMGLHACDCEISEMPPGSEENRKEIDPAVDFEKLFGLD